MRTTAAGWTRLAHITDTHTTLDGRPTTVLKHRSVEILKDVLDQVTQSQADCVLFGGDNIDNRGSGERDLEAFLALATRLSADGVDWRCIPGNHEASHPRPGRITKAVFQRRVADRGVAPNLPGFSHVVGNVRVIGLDTTLVGSPGGFVPADGLAFLADQLAEASEKHIVVLGHHLLVPCWEPYRFETWPQDYLVRNHEEVVEMLTRHPRVRAYLCGHHHAHRITAVKSGPLTTGFYQVLTASPVAFPHSARVLTFEDQAMIVETVRPRDPSILTEGREAVLLGRKAQRFAEMGASDAFLGYLEGEEGDHAVRLPYQLTRLRSTALPLYAAGWAS